MTMEQIDQENRMKALEAKANALYAAVFKTDAKSDPTKSTDARLDEVNMKLGKVEGNLAGDSAPDVTTPIEEEAKPKEPEAPVEEQPTSESGPAPEGVQPEVTAENQ